MLDRIFILKGGIYVKDKVVRFLFQIETVVAPLQ